MSFSSYEQVFIVNNQLVSGVMSVDAGYSTQTTPLYIAGMGYVDNFISGPTEGQFQVSRYMLGADFVQDIGDEDPVSGGLILDNGQSVGFTRGRLLNYTVSCNVGSVPEISNTFKAYGNLGGGISPITRWDSKTDYVVDDLVSISKTALTGNLKGLAEDLVYKCKADNTNIEPPGDTTKWELINLLEAKTILDEKFAMSKRTYTVPTQGSIKVSFAGSDLNSVLGFNYTRGIDLESLYALREEQFKGQALTDYEALDVQIIYPIKTQLDFSVSFDNYKLSDMRAFLDYGNWNNNKIEQDVFVKVYDPQDMDGAPIMEYKIDKAKLLSEAITAQTADDTTLKLSFEGFSTDPSTPDPYQATVHDVVHAVPESSVNIENKISQVKT